MNTSDRPNITIDFINKHIMELPNEEVSIARHVKKLDDALLGKFFEATDSFWHTENDQLQYFSYRGNGTYLCQRRKLKYDFVNKVNYWHTYNFLDAPVEKVYELCDKIEALCFINDDLKKYNSLEQIAEISQEAIYYERKYLKKLAEKNALLSASDWRVLPDVVDSFPGEKEMWMKWRDTLRNELIKRPEQFDTALEYFKYIYNLKYPVDPKIFFQMYPEGKDEEENIVEYLATSDQWVKYESEASSDLITANAVRLLNYTDGFRESSLRVKKSIMDALKEFDLPTIYPEYDISRYELDEEQ
jgi:hypothetical protein